MPKFDYNDEEYINEVSWERVPIKCLSILSFSIDIKYVRLIQAFLYWHAVMIFGPFM